MIAILAAIAFPITIRNHISDSSIAPLLMIIGITHPDVTCVILAELGVGKQSPLYKRIKIISDQLVSNR
jgi:hypothetical protein